jgi:hypothetical protein
MPDRQLMDMGARARKSAALHAWERVVLEIEDVYRQVLGNQAGDA